MRAPPRSGPIGMAAYAYRILSVFCTGPGSSHSGVGSWALLMHSRGPRAGLAAWSCGPCTTLQQASSPMYHGCPADIFSSLMRPLCLHVLFPRCLFVCLLCLSVCPSCAAHLVEAQYLDSFVRRFVFFTLFSPSLSLGGARACFWGSPLQACVSESV